MGATLSVEQLPHEVPRPEAQVNFYFIDFELSVHFASFAARKRILGFAGLNLVPELSDDVPYDPFAVDVRQFGDLVAKLHKVCVTCSMHSLYSFSFRAPEAWVSCCR